MKFELNDRVIWRDGLEPPLKGTIINLYNGITVRWDNRRVIYYNSHLLKEMSYHKQVPMLPYYYHDHGYIEIDLSYNRELKLNELGI